MPAKHLLEPKADVAELGEGRFSLNHYHGHGSSERRIANERSRRDACSFGGIKDQSPLVRTKPDGLHAHLGHANMEHMFPVVSVKGVREGFHCPVPCPWNRRRNRFPRSTLQKLERSSTFLPKSSLFAGLEKPDTAHTLADSVLLLVQASARFAGAAEEGS